MRLLLDTHVFLWFISNDPRLVAGFRDAIRDGRNDVFLSVAAVWEATIKQNLGKLALPGVAAEYLPVQRELHRIRSLPIEEPAIAQLPKLPPLHRDPFDRIMIAQALQHDLTIVTVDDAVLRYPANIFAPT